MATSLITTCDIVSPTSGEPHGIPATGRLKASVNGRWFEADLCDECTHIIERTFKELGVRPSMVLVDGKPRGAYVTAKGVPFTTAEAREWLIEQGYDVHPTAGRVSTSMLNIYADAH